MKTKITFLTIALFGLLSTQLMAQAKLGDNPTNVNPNVLLELESSDKGLLIPRLTSSERDSAFTTNIPNGLMIYNTTEDCLQVYKDGSGNWDCIEGTSGGVLTREGNVLRINNSNVDLSELLQLNLDAGDTNTSLLQLGDSQIILKEGTNIRLTEKDNILTITASGQGPAGPAGPQGPPGPQGPQGIQGSEGTDSQTLTLSGTILSISGGNSVTLATASGSNTDSQTLSFGSATTTQTTLKLRNDPNPLSIQTSGSLSLSQTDSHTLELIGGGQLIQITENGKTGYRLANFDPSKHGNIGTGAIDLSYQEYNSNSKGASGTHAFAAGDGTSAYGNYSVAMGQITSANDFSSAMGYNNKARGSYSLAMGYSNIASGTYSVALGGNNIALQDFTTVLGWGNKAQSRDEMVVGRFNTEYNPKNPTGWSPDDRLFVIGNGLGRAIRSDALVVLKNGNTGLGTSTPSATLHVSGTLRFVDGNQGANKVLTSDANGMASWQTPSGGGGTGTDSQTLSVSSGTTSTSVLNLTASTSVTFEAGNNIVLNEDLQNNTIIISATGSLTAGTDDQNLSVGAGTATTSLIQIETGAGITLEAGENIRLSEPTPSTIRIAAAAGQLRSLTETNTGYRLADADPKNHGNIGTRAIDLSYQSSTSTQTGATGDYAFASGLDTSASGYASTAMGRSSTASGIYSTAMGSYSTASREASIAMGVSSKASGARSTAMGSTTTASGDHSTAMGTGTTASGYTSTAMGLVTTAETYGQTTLGLYNTPETGKADERVDEDRLLVIGNGTGSLTTSRSDALVMLKNGNTELNGALTLDAANDGTGYTLPTAKGTAGQVLTMDNASTGTTIWTTISGGSGGNPTLSLVGDVLSISGTSSVSLAAYNDSGTDTQTLSVGAGDANTSLIQIQNGNEVTFEAGNNIVLSENTTNNTIIISATGSLTAGTDDQNLSVGAGDTDTSLIQIEGGDPITLQAGDNISLTESGNTIILNATGGGGGSGGGTLTGLVSITQNNFSGYRLAEEHLLGNHDPIGLKAVDLSIQENTGGASGGGAVAMGTNTTASGIRNTAIGTLSSATATESIAIGNAHPVGDGSLGPQATGNYSMAFGGASVASGERSITMGTLVTAESYGQTTLGLFNTEHPSSFTSTPTFQTFPSTNSWQATDRLFVIGNGKDAFDTSDALVMLKNGNTQLNGDFTVDGSISQTGTGILHADYVFESYFDGVSKFNKDYRLPSLSEVATFIKENKHLPGVQSRADIQKAGSWDVTENVRTNLEKVEELYLYTIEQENQIQSQSQQLEQQNRLIHQLLERIETLEKKME